MREFEEKLLVNPRPMILASYGRRLFVQQDLMELIAVKEHFGDELDVYIASEEDKQLYAERFEIGGYPVYLFFAFGKEVGRFLGSLTREDLKIVSKAYWLTQRLRRQDFSTI